MAKSLLSVIFFTDGKKSSLPSIKKITDGKDSLPSVVLCRQPLLAKFVFAVWPDEMLTAKNSTDGKSPVSRSVSLSLFVCVCVGGGLSSPHSYIHHL